MSKESFILSAGKSEREIYKEVERMWKKVSGVETRNLRRMEGGGGACESLRGLLVFTSEANNICIISN